MSNMSPYSLSNDNPVGAPLGRDRFASIVHQERLDVAEAFRPGDHDLVAFLQAFEDLDRRDARRAGADRHAPREAVAEDECAAAGAGLVERAAADHQDAVALVEHDPHADTLVLT